jgi:hypothetical protein
MDTSAPALELRQPLWIALSALYLDTEPDWNGVAAVCSSSPFELAELQRILFDEVHPVVHLNLWSAAGVWDGFDQEWLIRSILSHKQEPLFRLPWPEARRYPWCELKPRIVAARQPCRPAP